MDARAGCEMVSTQSTRGELSIVNGYPNRQQSRTSGRACCFVFGYRLGTGLPPWGPPPHPGPAVHSGYGNTALHVAAAYGNRRMIRSLVDANADVNAQDRTRCAVCACGESAVPLSAPAESPPPSAVQPDAAALFRVQWPFFIRRGAAAARRRRGRPDQQRVPLRCAAQPKPKTATAARAQAHAEAMGGRMWDARGVRGGREAGALRPPPHSPPHPPNAASADGYAVGSHRRHSPIQRAGRRRSTRTVIHALAARLAVHYCTGGSKCRAHLARAAAAIGSAKCALARSLVPRTARGAGTERTQTHVPRDAVRVLLSAHSARLS
jgi:hypothetical protein